MTAALSGRKAQAARNDEVILAAARAVFIADPGAPISAVAEHAGVGISALYRRYASKEELLRKLCGDGLDRYIAESEKALADDRDPWVAFTAFMAALVDADTNSLTARLAGTFTPTPELYEAAVRAESLDRAIYARTQPHFRDGIVVEDFAVILEQLTSIRLGDDHRTTQLRHRYLALMLEAMHRPSAQPPPLPGPPPTVEELTDRWRRAE
ncbi:TetR/AcrR family transcriptional regulator [Kribbella sandramycini]|uniref:AcrR family transcriptional regulator n=1 Tax=Kribbella sandramycini TaxID=60450 RepID=A0A7Y4P2S7_9ACTN|nr:TetR/AcrR family transcriptional regulator [Kribbella sandramycini]MBB6566096.1 AcrR family transcriptional regulator [Kribbella sandramycini]NOL45096.1 TetR/AcrR family transcriptional regulator [Kribbella sandramycini]